MELTFGKAIKALKKGKKISRVMDGGGCYYKLFPGKCPENSGYVEDFINGISINLYDISTNIDKTIIEPEILAFLEGDEELNIPDEVHQALFSIEDILAEDWYVMN